MPNDPGTVADCCLPLPPIKQQALQRKLQSQLLKNSAVCRPVNQWQWAAPETMVSDMLFTLM